MAFLFEYLLVVDALALFDVLDERADQTHLVDFIRERLAFGLVKQVAAEKVEEVIVDIDDMAARLFKEPPEYRTEFIEREEQLLALFVQVFSARDLLLAQREQSVEFHG